MLCLTGFFTTFIAIYIDTKFYTDKSVTWSYLFSHPTITPLNNLAYNLSTSNLAEHGLHPWYQHALANLPQLLGPAAILLFFKPHLSLRLYSALSGMAVLSVFKHQEARFLLPTIPLILSSVQLPKRRLNLRLWIGSWIVFNVLLGLLMGVYHQGGVIPMQKFLSKQPDATHAIWWKTYSPPIWLLNGKSEVLTIHDAMGMKGELLMEKLKALATCDMGNKLEEQSTGTYLIAPSSATFLDQFMGNDEAGEVRFMEAWKYKRHINLDDLDFWDDGVWDTLQRVIGRRGLSAWMITKECSA